MSKLVVAELSSAVKTLWYNRDRELPELPRSGWSWQQQTDPDEWLTRDFTRKLVEVTPLTEVEEQVVTLCLIQGYTSKEAGEVLDITGVHVRKILDQCVRKFRYYQSFLTGVRTLSWVWWGVEGYEQ